MKQTLMIIFTLFLLVGCGKQKAPEVTVIPVQSSSQRLALEAQVEREKAISYFKALVLDRLKDPDSAKFTGVKLNGDYTALCGAVNAKNTMGGYAGKRLFVASSDNKVVFEDSDPIRNIVYRSRAAEYNCPG